MQCHNCVCLCVSGDASSSDSHLDDDDDEAVKADRLSPGRPDDEEELPVYLWRPGQTTDVIGEWEQHTRVSRDFTYTSHQNLLLDLPLGRALLCHLLLYD